MKIKPFYKCYCSHNTHKCRYPHYTQHNNCPITIQRETSLLEMNKDYFVVIHTNTITLKCLRIQDEAHTRSYQDWSKIIAQEWMIWSKKDSNIFKKKLFYMKMMIQGDRWYSKLVREFKICFQSLIYSSQNNMVVWGSWERL